MPHTIARKTRTAIAVIAEGAEEHEILAGLDSLVVAGNNLEALLLISHRSVSLPSIVADFRPGTYQNSASFDSLDEVQDALRGLVEKRARDAVEVIDTAKRSESIRVPRRDSQASSPSLAIPANGEETSLGKGGVAPSNSEMEHNRGGNLSDPLPPKPPETLQKLKWLLLHGRQHWGLLVAAAVLLGAGVLVSEFLIQVVAPRTEKPVSGAVKAEGGRPTEGAPQRAQPATVRFVDVIAADALSRGATAALRIVGRSNGVAWGDFDGDGDPDLYVTNVGFANKLFRNDGSGGFSDVTPAPLGDVADGSGAAWGDFDNDGFLDLYLANAERGHSRLFRNLGGTFRDVTSSPLDIIGNRAGTWADFDNDGDLDLYSANLAGNKLLRNDGRHDQSFYFVDATSGPLGDAEYSQGAAWGDYDNDGDLDLYVPNDQGPNKLFRNDGNGVFITEARGISWKTRNSTSAAWGDYDNDGDLDLYVGNTTQDANFLLRNDSRGALTDVTSAPLGGEDSTQGIAWVDYDNDGDLDLYLANNGPNRLLQNESDGSFVEVTRPPMGNSRNSTGTAWADYDGDGDLDLYLATYDGPNLLLRNDLSDTQHWFHVALIGSCSNRSGIGARMKLVSGAHSQIREITGGAGFHSSESLTAHFGLGGASVVDQLIIRWPSGIVQRFEGLAADRRVVAVEQAREGDDCPR